MADYWEITLRRTGDRRHIPLSVSHRVSIYSWKESIFLARSIFVGGVPYLGGMKMFFV